MKIVQVTPVYPPYRGGIGTVAQEYAQGLRERGHDVHVVTPDYREGAPQERYVHRLRGAVFGKAAVLPQLMWRLRGFDVLHLHYPFYGAAIFCALAAKIFNIPLVVTYHMKTRASGVKNIFFKLHRLFVEPFIFAASARILVSSTDYAKSAGVKGFKVKEQPFGVDTEQFSPGEEKSVRKKLGISNQETVFLFVGGLDNAHYFKGVDVLLNAAADLPADLVWRLLIVGGGAREAKLKALAQQLGIAKAVVFTGRVSEDRLEQMYRAADVHVLPSIDRSEAYGLVTLEAAASGLPSIVSNLPGVRTLVDHRKTGLVVPPNDVQALARAMARTVSDPEFVARAGVSAGKRAASMYNRETLLDRLQSTYKAVTVGGG